MILANELCKVYRRTVKDEEKKKKAQKIQDFYAVDHVSLYAFSGEILGILGPNGAGKTTLLRMLSGLMKPDEGLVKILDKDNKLITDIVDIKKRIGYLSGNTRLYQRFSTRELLTMLSEIYGLSKEDTEDRIEEVVEILNLHSFIDNTIGKLSTGQTQRANIARCILHKPDIYIFDEPTLGLDILSSEAIVDFMKSERDRGKTILYSTHYMEEAQYMCDKIAFIHEGKLVNIDKPSNIMTDTNTNNLRDAFKKLALTSNN